MWTGIVLPTDRHPFIEVVAHYMKSGRQKLISLTECNVQLTTYPSQRPGKHGIAWTSLRGGPMRRALETLGDKIIESEGVFDERVKVVFGSFWKETAV